MVTRIAARQTASGRLRLARASLLCCRLPLFAARPLVSITSSKRGQYSISSTGERVIFSGIQPTGVPHLGNFLGAILPWVQLQNDSSATTKLFYSIVDLHALTSRQPASARLESRRYLLASLLAAGLDPVRCTLFYQSAVSAHAELHWILSCNASTSVLVRMTQWKSKLNEQSGSELLTQTPNPKNMEKLKLGLFSYPVLQAADILVHQATHVPIGDDQRQHVEFARTCAQVFNNIYCTSGDGQSLGDVFTLPELVVSDAAKRVMSLTEPEKKMSKSHENVKSRVVLTDSDIDIRRKFRSALTDSLPGIDFDPKSRPGVSNLIHVIASLRGTGPDDVTRDLRNSSLRILKETAADLVIERFAPMREKLSHLVGERGGVALDDIAAEGAQRARQSAEGTMKRVRRAVGI